MTDVLYYLAYGSNLHPLRIETRLGDVERIGAARLDGWKLAFHKRGADGSGKGNLQQGSGRTAWGVIYAINARQKAMLDTFEGDGYAQVAFPVTVDGKHYNAFAYIAEPDWVDNRLLPHDWYQELIALGANHAGFPADYLQHISNYPHQQEPTGQQRHAEMLRLMREMQECAC